MSAAAPIAALSLLLRPLQEVVASGPGSWIAIGDDPQFEVTWPDGAAGGLYRLMFDLEVPPGSDPCIFLDLGDGWSEETRVPLARWVGGTWSCMARIAQPLRFRMDPFSGRGAFSLGECSALAVNEVEAVLERLGNATERTATHLASLVASLQESVALGEDVACQVRRCQLNPRDPYSAWIDAFATPDAQLTEQVRREVALMDKRPLVSVLLDLADLDATQLSAALAAMVGQLYPDWDLRCHAPAGKATPAHQSVLEHYAANCTRIAAGILDSNALDELMGGCDGGWVVPLQSGAQAAPHALFALVNAALGRAGSVLVYADEDRISPEGVRELPCLKSTWDIELTRAGADQCGPFALYETRALCEASRSEARGLYGALERVRSRVTAAEAIHVPLVLVRVNAGEVHRKARGSDEQTRAVPASLPSVALVVPTRDRVELLSRCVDRILESRYPRLEVLVVDNGSVEQDTLEYLVRIVQDPRVRVLRDERPFNYSAINNTAVASVEAEVVGLVNNDIEPITPDWIERMMAHVVQPDVGAVGAMLYYPDDSIQHAGVVIGAGGVAAHAFTGLPRGSGGPHGALHHARSVSAVTAACLLVRRAVYLQAGGFDESLAVAFNDIDFCLRLRSLGYRVVWTPAAELYHHESASRGSEDSPEKQARFENEVRFMLDRWGPDLLCDPAHHPALSLDPGRTHELAWPPRYGLHDWIRAPTYAGRQGTQWPRTFHPRHPGATVGHT
jgi:GT2 family glycosyltransferase